MPAPSVSTPPPSVPATLDGRIIRQLQQVMRDDFSLLLVKYLEEAEKLFMQLNGAVREGDRDNIIAYAHSLKSCSANVGALALRGTMDALHKAAKQDAAPEYAHLLVQAEAELHSVFQEIRRLAE